MPTSIHEQEPPEVWTRLPTYFQGEHEYSARLHFPSASTPEMQSAVLSCGQLRDRQSRDGKGAIDEVVGKHVLSEADVAQH